VQFFEMGVDIFDLVQESLVLLDRDGTSLGGMPLQRRSTASARARRWESQFTICSRPGERQPP
jgi:hypothetical protein